VTETPTWGLNQLKKNTMNINQKSSADHIIEHLKSIDVDGETMQYIIDETAMSHQMLKQLIMQASDSDINPILDERSSFHDRGSNSHLAQELEINQLKHRLSMVMDDLQSIRKFIHENNLSDTFAQATNQCDEAWTHLNNIEIACDLNTDESLVWRKFSK
jgi:hypothetical protein